MIDRLLNPHFLASFTTAVTLYTLYHLTAEKLIPMPPRIRSSDNKAKKRDDYRRYLAIYGSLGHAVLNLAITGWIYLNEGAHFDYTPNNSTHYVMVGFSLGYYIMDTFFGYVYKYGSLANDLHHFLTIGIFLYLIYKDIGANVFSFYLFVAEIPNPFMHIRKNLMMFVGIQTYLRICGIMFTVAYLSCRVVWLGSTTTTLAKSELPLVFKAMLFSVLYLSLYWSYIVVEVFLKNLREVCNQRWVADLHEAISSVWKSTTKIAILHAVLFVAAFGKMIYYWAHKEVF